MDFAKALELIKTKLLNWVDDIIRLTPNVVLALLIMTVGVLVVRLVKKTSLKLFRKATDKQALIEIFWQITQLVIIILFGFVALSILGLDKTVTSVLAGAGVAGIALAFAFQDMAANFISGLFLAFKSPFRINDIIHSGEHTGWVKQINLRDTVIRTFQGQRIIIPNRQIFQNPLENVTVSRQRRVDLEVGVHYNSDLEQVRTVAQNALKDLPNLIKDQPLNIFFTEFGDSSINLVAQFWLNDGAQPVFLLNRSEAIISIKKAFDREGINIPFPIRTLDAPWLEKKES